jgi:arsenate reductase
MRELGIDLSTSRPQLLTDDLARNATLLITMGCGEACPYLPNLRREDWPLPDPKNRSLEEVRVIRDQIRHRVQSLLLTEGLLP